MSVEQNGKKQRDRLGRTSWKGDATKDCKTMAEEGENRRGKDLEVEAEEINEEEGGSPEVIVAGDGKAKTTSSEKKTEDVVADIEAVATK
ncbi:hypothetical protein Tsubulata_002317 [Turnera subulata]|uniref:Uncharacterized protein n=1 Tax=Turnera subulata TaxID=218843 RepID=A0A9Q0FEG1_9ROSI|nr:hypothetical protein Tsubulata_002317 [Turnera subulata]